MSETETLPISADLLEILRDPRAVQEPEKYGPDPGQLELVHNSWLVSADTGYKYPIKDGIPVMLIEEGERWKDTPVDELPVPPETADPTPVAASTESYPLSMAEEGRSPVFFVIGGVVMLLAAFVIVKKLMGRSSEE